MSYKTDWFQGVFPAIITPFDSDENIDEKALRNLVQHLLPDVTGFVVAGTTGEMNYLSDDEIVKITQIVVEEAGEKTPVIVGTGRPSTRATAELTRRTADTGAKAALIVTPYYLKPQFNEIISHYEKLDKIGFPTILYNIPQCSGVHKRWFTAEGLCELDNVIGIKDSSGDMPFFMTLLEKLKGKVSIICGHDEIGLAALAAGADGLILASANLIPNLWMRMYRLVKEGNIAEAQELQSQLQILVRTIVRTNATQAVKEGLGMMGIEVGNSRLPIAVGDAFKRDDREELRIHLERLGMIDKSEIEFCVNENGKNVTVEYPAVPETPMVIADFTMKVGEGFCGPPFSELAHIDLLLGNADGPVGKAIERALAEPAEIRKGREVSILTDKPRTLLVPTVTMRGAAHRDRFENFAAVGVLNGIQQCIKDGVLPEALLQDLAMIVNVFVHPSARNKTRLRVNNFKAIRHAVRKAIEKRPSMDELVKECATARHPFRYTP